MAHEAEDEQLDIELLEQARSARAISRMKSRCRSSRFWALGARSAADLYRCVELRRIYNVH
jgi:hypothetical protein